MSKKLISIALVMMLGVALTGCVQPSPPAPAAPAAPPAAAAPATPEPAPADAPEEVADGEWRVGIITGTVSQNEEEYLAARLMQERFGSDRIIRTTYPDNFGAEMEVVIANIQALADQGAQAIVVVQAVPGTMAAIQSTRELFGEDIFFFAGVTQEPPAEISQFADIAMISDDLSMGRAIMEQAYAMGADTFAHISFPRHLGMENIAARRALLMETAEEKGIRWVELTAPDPMAEGVAQAQMFILENVPRWVAEHGQNTAFFSTNCGMQEPLITQIANYGGFYPLQCCPSPFHALPAAMNVSMAGHEGDVHFLIDELTRAFEEAGAAGRFSTWPVPVNMLLVEVGVLYSIEYLEGRTNGRHDTEALKRVIDEVAASYGTSVQLSNWPLADGTYIENFYRVLSDFVTF